MTARRSSATERRGVGSAPRPAALSAAALAVVLAGSGCASRNANTAGTAAPVNQDTAAIAQDEGLPRPPRAAAHALAPPFVSELPSATTTLPTVTTDPPTTEKDLGNQIVTLMKNPLTIGLTPKENPAAGKPVLEVVGMPTWLWIEGLPPVMEVKTTFGGTTTTVRVWAAMDTVTWTADGAPGPVFTCGGGPAGNGYGIPYDGVYHANGDNAPNACVNTFSTPYYSTGGGATTAGVHTLMGSVNYHIAYTETDTTGKITNQGTVAVPNVVTVNTRTTQLRVGEIQALATTP